jgi:hypothetical protein
MPFMPEMLGFIGKRFQVYKRAHKTCDTVFPVRGRRVKRTVHLETRCDGQAHGGCEATCLIFWKEAWVRRAGVRSDPDETQPAHDRFGDEEVSSTAGCAEATLWDRATAPATCGGVNKYVCQATQLPYATEDLSWWDVRQYWEDYWSGNVGIRRMFSGLVYSMYYNLSQAGIGLGRPMRWVYNKLRPVWRGSLFPRTSGTIPGAQPTPAVALDLQPGELVRVKSLEQILQTVSINGKNRGLWWDAEMVPYCGGTYRVLKRVTRIIDEKTGRMQEMKTPCIILDSVMCQSRYSGCRMFCPRAIYSYWREIWLERVSESAPNSTVPGIQAHITTPR